MVAIKLMMDELKTTIMIIKIMTKTFLQVVVGTLIQCIFFFFSQTGFLTGKHACFFSTWSGVCSRCGVGEKGQETLQNADRQTDTQTDTCKRRHVEDVGTLQTCFWTGSLRVVHTELGRLKQTWIE